MIAVLPFRQSAICHVTESPMDRVYWSQTIGVDHTNGFRTKKAFYWHVNLPPTLLKKLPCTNHMRSRVHVVPPLSWAIRQCQHTFQMHRACTHFWNLLCTLNTRIHSCSNYVCLDHVSNQFRCHLVAVIVCQMHIYLVVLYLLHRKRFCSLFLNWYKHFVMTR